jgi:serine/threonine-protein kinase
VGRYLVFAEIAAGGMATVHLGRLIGSAGFARTVAIKRLHPTFAKDPDFVSMFTDEARLAARIRHPNVAATLDVVSADGELFLVMEYIDGESLFQLLRRLAKRKEVVPVPIAVATAIGALHGLHAAHEATTEQGEPLEVVHRDVSPQNIIVGTDGVARVLDFGVAKAVGRLQTTREGEVKGKCAYMAPEQLAGQGVDRRVDVYAASVVLWETLTGHRLFVGDSTAEVVGQVLGAVVEAPSRYAQGIPHALDAVVMRGLCRDPALRFATALEMARALERAIPLPTPRDIGEWVVRVAAEALELRHARVQEMERASTDVSAHGKDALPSSGVVAAVTDTATRGSVLPSQVSSISVATPVYRRKSAKRRAYWLAAVPAAAAAVVALTVASKHSPPADASPSAVTADRIAESQATAPLASETAAPPLVSPAGSAEPSHTGPGAATGAEAATNAQRRTPLPTSRSPSHGPPRPPASAAPRSTGNKCDPPFIVDRDGIHIPKPECG